MNCDLCNSPSRLSSDGRTQMWRLNNYYGISGRFCNKCYDKVSHNSYGIPNHPISYKNILKKLIK